jgi:glycosyltransferase involved in cell wall biosynthesis
MSDDLKPDGALLCLVQLPPPLHGVSRINALIVDCVLPNAGIEHEVINMTTAQDLSAIGERRISRILWLAARAAPVVGKVLLRLLRSPGSVVYASPALDGVALARDSAILAFASLLGRRVIIHLHGTGLGEAVGLRRAMLRVMLRRAWVILLSERLYPDVQAFAPRSRCAVVPNGVEVRDSPRHYDQPVQSILYMANLDPRKGLLDVLEIFVAIASTLPSARLDIAGGPTGFFTREDLNTYLSKLDAAVARRIVFHDFVSGERKQRLFENADIFLYPSWYDSFGLVVAEAMSYGIPVVSSSVGSLPDLVLHEETGFRCQTRTEFAARIIELSADCDLRRRMGESGRLHQRRCFDNAAFETRLIAALRRFGVTRVSPNIG